jgi:hypothetical protein
VNYIELILVFILKPLANSQIWCAHCPLMVANKGEATRVIDLFDPNLFAREFLLSLIRFLRFSHVCLEQLKLFTSPNVCCPSSGSIFSHPNVFFFLSSHVSLVCSSPTFSFSAFSLSILYFPPLLLERNPTVIP